jgi:hypothetical protein
MLGVHGERNVKMLRASSELRANNWGKLARARQPVNLWELHWPRHMMGEIDGISVAPTARRNIYNNVYNEEGSGLR